MTGLIILAAGSSARLGQPKQNLVFQNKTLLQRAIETGLSSECKPVIIVLGANTDLIGPAIHSEGIKVIYNPGWNEGMASSIRAGIKAVEKDKTIDRVLIMLCDQPFVSPELINEMLLKQQQTAKTVIACSYNNTVGVPVLFDRSVFAELLLLKGNEGAKHILKDHLHHIATVPFERGNIDIDTLEDYERLIGTSK